MSTTLASLPGVRIGGVPVEAASPWIHAVLNPSTGTEVAHLVGGGVPEAVAAVRSAMSVQPTWENTRPVQRASVLRAIAADLRTADVAEELATLISQETGKRIAEARAEVGLSAQFFDWFAVAISTEHSQRWDVVPNIEHVVSKHPLGIVAVVTPWNFPVSIPARKIAPALAAGCPVLFKPSEVAPTSALRFAELVEARVPAGVINTVLGDAPAVMEAWLSHPAVRGLTFTGSTRVGTILATSAASRFVRCVLELGGNAPFIVLDDANLRRAVELLLIAKYRNNGQSCIAANQVWVPRQLLDDFAVAFVEASNTLVLGDPLDEQTTLGPLALPTDAGRIRALFDDAAAAGTTVIKAGVDVPAEGHFAPPMICIEPGPDSVVRSEEIFGPGISINGYDDVDEVIATTRASRHGLGGYVVGQAHRAAAVARSLDVGIVGVNNATPNTPQVPFGGLKFSGCGWEGGEAGLEAFLTYRTVAVSA